VIVHRIEKARRIGSAFTGEGARIAGGRWNPVGVSAVYCSDSLALAALEVFVHLGHEGRSLAFVSFRVEIPDDTRIERVDPLPPGWRAEPPVASSQEVGYRWARTGATAVLLVPSAIVPGEFNALLNPTHADFRRVAVGKPEPFSFDPRLWKS
jgi:RES domain-containing protein